MKFSTHRLSSSSFVPNSTLPLVTITRPTQMLPHPWHHLPPPRCHLLTLEDFCQRKGDIAFSPAHPPPPIVTTCCSAIFSMRLLFIWVPIFISSLLKYTHPILNSGSQGTMKSADSSNPQDQRAWTLKKSKYPNFVTATVLNIRGKLPSSWNNEFFSWKIEMVVTLKSQDDCNH